MAGSDRIGKKPFRPHQGKASTFRSYVKANQPSTADFEKDVELVAVPKEEKEADPVNEAIEQLRDQG